MEKSIAVEGTV